jgi:TRAP-type C4-dicarboxylate transport system substrate-binding protein
MAEPVKLKLAFFTSDRASVYLSAVKPFVDAVNAEGKGVIEIEVYFSGTLGRQQDKQSQLLLDGVADIAFVIPGILQSRFHDNTIIELPGLFRDLREATLVYTRLTAANALKGYEQFVVLGAYGSELESLHTRPPAQSLDDFRGMTIRVNNPTAGLALGKLGMKPEVMQIQNISSAISSGSLEGAAVPLSMLFEFGIGRVATHHYFLRTSSAPLALLMSRTKFDSLPPKAQDIIRKFSGEWSAERFIEVRARIENDVMTQLKSDARRTFVLPSAADVARARAVFKAVTEEVAAEAPHNREILTRVSAEIAKLRTAE